jgi:hypothetical protein
MQTQQDANIKNKRKENNLYIPGASGVRAVHGEREGGIQFFYI